MDQPIHFDNLREITGGDRELEAELFQSFLDSSDACVEKMRAALAAESAEQWRAAAHALKGVCLNLGALRLGDFCYQAQLAAVATAAEKRQQIATIEDELARVQAAIETARSYAHMRG